MTSLTVSPVAARNALKRDLRGNPMQFPMMATDTDAYITDRVRLALFGTHRYNGTIPASKWWSYLNL